jgi:hypothetical protein
MSNRAITQGQAQAAEQISLCHLLAQPNSYLGRAVTLRVQVKIFRHGTSISDSTCSGRSLLLVSNPNTNETESASKFYQLLSQHRRTHNTILAVIEGRLVKGSEHGFVLKRDYDFQLDSVSTFSEEGNSKKP